MCPWQMRPLQYDVPLTHAPLNGRIHGQMPLAGHTVRLKDLVQYKVQ